MYMNPITKTILDNSFGEYRSILGSLIKAYVECQKKINSIVKRKNGNIDIDIRLCYLYSQAQNYLLMEILINYLIITKIHEINEGVLKLYGGKEHAESPEWIPACSICCNIPPIKIFTPSEMTSTSISIASVR